MALRGRPEIGWDAAPLASEALQKTGGNAAPKAFRGRPEIGGDVAPLAHEAAQGPVGTLHRRPSEAVQR